MATRIEAHFTKNKVAGRVWMLGIKDIVIGRRSPEEQGEAVIDDGDHVVVLTMDQDVVDILHIESEYPFTVKISTGDDKGCWMGLLKKKRRTDKEPGECAFLPAADVEDLVIPPKFVLLIMRQDHAFPGDTPLN